MASHAILPFEIRLKIYENCLVNWYNATGIYAVPSHISFAEVLWMIWPKGRVLIYRPKDDVRDARVKLPVPSVLQVESGEARSRLLIWLVKEGVNTDRRAPILRFPDLGYIPVLDFLYLQSPTQIHTFSNILTQKDISWSLGGVFAGRIHRILLPASIRHAEYLRLFLERLDALHNIEELAFAFVELDNGELKFIDSVPKKNPAAYTLERLGDGDIADYRRKLTRSIEGLDALIRPMLGKHSRGTEITACKMIPRC